MTSRGCRHGVRVSWQPMRDDEELGLFKFAESCTSQVLWTAASELET